MKLNIQTGRENEILRTISTELSHEDWKKLAPVGREMVAWLKAKENGAGLAAPQVGYNKRLIAVNLYDEDEDGLIYIRTVLMVNPKIVSHSDEIYNDEEGCFSVPGEYGFVKRWNSIVVEYFDEKFTKRSMRLSNFSGRVVQHEIDHLDGVLFTDKLEKLSVLHQM